MEPLHIGVPELRVDAETGPVTLTEASPLSWIAPVSVRCPAVRRSGGDVPNAWLRNASLLVTRIDGGMERAWSLEAEDWVPLSDVVGSGGATEAADLGALEPVDDDPLFPWSGTIALAEPERYERAPAGAMWPRYAVRCYFEAQERREGGVVVEYAGLSARSAAVSVPDEPPFLAGVELEEETEEPKFIRMYLLAPDRSARGEIRLQRDDAPEGVLLRSVQGADDRARLLLGHDRRVEIEAAGAQILLTADGDVEVVPAPGRSARVHGVVVSRSGSEVWVRPESLSDVLVLDASVRITGRLDVDGDIYERGRRVRTVP